MPECTLLQDGGSTWLLGEDRDIENNMEYGMKKVQQIYMQRSNSSTELITWDDKP
jgi:hypothetical protein